MIYSPVRVVDKLAEWIVGSDEIDYRPAVLLPGRVSPFPVARIFAATEKKVNSFFSPGVESRLAIRFGPD
jgi:hypothetical protein